MPSFSPHPSSAPSSSLLEKTLQEPFNRSTGVPTKPQCMPFNLYPKLFCSDASPLLSVLAWEVYEGLQKNSDLIKVWCVDKIYLNHFHGWLLLQHYTLFFCSVCNISLPWNMMHCFEELSGVSLQQNKLTIKFAHSETTGAPWGSLAFICVPWLLDLPYPLRDKTTVFLSRAPWLFAPDNRAGQQL